MAHPGKIKFWISMLVVLSWVAMCSIRPSAAEMAITPSPTLTAVSRLIPGDPADALNPDLAIGDNEVVMAASAWQSGRSLPGVGRITKAAVIELVLYWIDRWPVNRELPSISREALRQIGERQTLKLPTQSSPGPVQITRNLSASKVRPGSSFTVSISIEAHQEISIVRLFDLLPQGWQVEGNPFSVQKRLKTGEVRQVTYSVTVPKSAWGRVELVGLAKSELGQLQAISGDAYIVVTPEAPLSLEEALMGPDGILSDAEFFRVMDLWISGEPVPATGGKTITDGVFFKLLDLWIATPSQVLPTPGFLDPATPLLQSSTASYLEITGTPAASIHVQVYDLNGKHVFSQKSEGSKIRLRTSNPEGRLLAQGVYLYVVTVKGFDGSWATSEVRKLVLLR